MTEIIPAILTADESDYETKLKSLERIFDWVQIDIVDGQFAKNSTIDYRTVGFYETSLKTEVHLMVVEVKEAVENFLAVGVDRIIFPLETEQNIEEIITLIKESGVQVGLSLNIETPIEKVESYLEKLDVVLLMAVKVGFQEGQFQEEVLEKIKFLKKKYPDAVIEVDGGIKPDIARKAVESGADILISGSFIFEYGNINKAIELLEKEVN